MKRDKVITLRVRSDLYNKANEIIENNTETYETYRTKRYFNYLPDKYTDLYRTSKFSIADVLEIALNECIKDCNTNKSN